MTEKATTAWEITLEEGGEEYWITNDHYRVGPAIVFEKESAHLIAAAPELLEALEATLGRYIELAGSGDCGFWNPEEEEQVIEARAAIAKAKGEGE